MTDTERIKKMKVEINELTSEFVRLKKFEEQMLDQQPYKVGDRVQLTRDVLDIDYDRSYGWRGYSQMLQPTNTGTIEDVRWNEFCREGRGAWQVAWKPDIDWSSSVITDRLHVWVEHESHRHIFYMPYRYVCHAGKNRKPLLPPSGAYKYELVNIPVGDKRLPSGRRLLSYEEVLGLTEGVYA